MKSQAANNSMHKGVKYNQHLIIIGGTSGIGLALAKDHLQRGWSVTIVGSSSEKIKRLGCIFDTESKLTIFQCDISQPEQLQELCSKLESQPFNKLVYSAGWYLNERKWKLDQADSSKMLSINLHAFQQVFFWASEQLKRQEGSMLLDKHLICLASIAGMLNYAESSLYAQCKHAMIATSQAYRKALAPFKIKVTCIASGYVDTTTLRGLNAGDASHKPFIISEKQAIEEINHAIDNNLSLHCFPKQMHRITMLLDMLPESMLNKVMKWQYKKQDVNSK